MIPFNKVSISDIEKKYIDKALKNGKLCGDGEFTKLCCDWFKEKMSINNVLLTTSCSHALDMAALLIGLKQGDEVIVPSYTFVSTANAIILRGATPIFVDIDNKTMNMNVELIEEKITSKTKAIFPVHYAGISCDMDKLISIAHKYNLKIVEDAAQCVGSLYKGIPLGTIGDYGCYSFHETKNYVMGEGGALITKNRNDFFRAEIVREKGTDRSQFIRGSVDKYTWRDIGSSYLPSDILSAILYGQLERFDEIMSKRLHIWNTYHKGLEELEKSGKLTRQYVPEYAKHNAHMYYIILNDTKQRDEVIEKLKKKGIISAFHYIPLHDSPMGEKLGYKKGDLPITEEYSSRLVRLPLWADMTDAETQYVIDSIKDILIGE